MTDARDFLQFPFGGTTQDGFLSIAHRLDQRPRSVMLRPLDEKDTWLATVVDITDTDIRVRFWRTTRWRRKPRSAKHVQGVMLVNR